jgi:heterodisulfide reductase subunit A
MANAHAIGFAQRGTEKIVTTPFGEESDVCINCGACAKVCPTGAIYIEDSDAIRHDELMLGPDAAISVPTGQAVPNVPRLDEERCFHFQRDGCGICAPNCPAGAIDYEMEDEEIEVEAGTAVVATGFQVFDPSAAEQYGYGRFPNVITSLEFERLSNASGPTGGKILMQNGKEPESIAILHCIGSRDENYHRYCSRVCCMYALKFAHLVREKLGADVYQMYIDMRSFGKGYEEFYDRLLKEGALFVRGKGAEVTDFAETDAEKGKLIVKCEDTLISKQRRVAVDMVILCVALEARSDSRQVERMFNLCSSEDGFFLEAHMKLRPVDFASEGLFLCGTNHAPKFITETISQANAVAARAATILSKKMMPVSGQVAWVDPDKCISCMTCVHVCPYMAPRPDRNNKAEIQAAVCMGCGSCTAECPARAIDLRNFVDAQILGAVNSLLAYEEGEKSAPTYLEQVGVAPPRWKKDAK